MPKSLLSVCAKYFLWKTKHLKGRSQWPLKELGLIRRKWSPVATQGEWAQSEYTIDSSYHGVTLL